MWFRGVLSVALVICTTTTTRAIETTTTTVRLTDTDGTVLVEGANRGMLQLNGGGAGGWKHVCDDMFDNNLNGANVACKELGYDGGVSLSAGRVVVAPSLDFYDEVNCTGDEAHLADCDRDAEHNCNERDEAVDLCCVTPDDGCNVGSNTWVSYSNYEYAINTRRLAWADAQSACEANGAQLVTVNSTQLQNQLTAAGMFPDDFFGEMFAWSSWIGCNDVDVEGTFAWVGGASCDKGNGFSAWEADDFDVAYDPEEAYALTYDCVYLSSLKDFGGSVWHSSPCISLRMSICERPAQTPLPAVTAASTTATTNAIVAGPGYVTLTVALPKGSITVPVAAGVFVNGDIVCFNYDCDNAAHVVVSGARSRRSVEIQIAPPTRRAYARGTNLTSAPPPQQTETAKPRSILPWVVVPCAVLFLATIILVGRRYRQAPRKQASTHSYYLF